MNELDQMLRWPEVAALVKMSRNTVAKEERAGRFPHRHQLTNYAVGWRLSEVQAWVAGERNWREAKSA